MRVRLCSFAIGVEKRHKPSMAIVETFSSLRIEEVRNDQPAE